MRAFTVCALVLLAAILAYVALRPGKQAVDPHPGETLAAPAEEQVEKEIVKPGLRIIQRNTVGCKDRAVYARSMPSGIQEAIRSGQCRLFHEGESVFLVESEPDAGLVSVNRRVVGVAGNDRVAQEDDATWWISHLALKSELEI